MNQQRQSTENLVITGQYFKRHTDGKVSFLRHNAVSRFD